MKCLALLMQVTTSRYTDDNGSDLTIDLSNNQPFTVVDGMEGYDMVPGEVATFPQDINSHVNFTGTFLSLIPFSIKYGTIKPGELEFDFENRQITNICGRNSELVEDFKKHLTYHEGNSMIDEFGIGTNQGVTEVYGLNSVFEERHTGLHLGLGGRAHGSLHLDLLFAGGDLYCGSELVYKNGQYRI